MNRGPSERDENFADGPHRISRGDFFGAIFCALIVLGASFVLLWHNPRIFWNDDYEISVLPVFADVARSWSEGHWPLLSPYSWICSNLAGEFQYGTFSLFINPLIVAIWKFPLTFPQQAAALSIAHLLALAVGAYLLARDRNFSGPLATMVAIVAALNGWIICWGATDWFGALGAFAWLPWSWWAMERALDPRRERWRFLWPAPFVYLLVTGGFPYTIVMLAVLTLWLTLKSLGEKRDVLPLALGLLLGFGLSAPAWLALFDYMHGSARELQPASAHWQWLLPWRALPGFILPNWTVNWSDFSTRLVPHAAVELASGLVAPAALCAGLLVCFRSFVRQMKWELCLLLVVLVISMLPSASVFRWSFRWLPFLHLILALCAAEALRQLDFARAMKPHLRVFSSVGCWALLLVIASAAIMIICGAAGPGGFVFPSVLAAIALLWLLLELLPPRYRLLQIWAPAAVALSALLATYISLPTNAGVPKYPLSQNLLSPAPLDPQRLYLSIYPPPETAYRDDKLGRPLGETVRPGSTSMWAGLRFINGYSPIRAAGVAREFTSYIHGEIDPGAAEYLVGWQAGNDGELAMLGVDGIIVAREMTFVPQQPNEWSLVASTQEGRVYHRRGEPLPQVRAMTSLPSLPNESFSPSRVKIIENSRNHVTAEVSAPNNANDTLLVFSRPFFHGYQARLGNEKLVVDSYRNLMPIVRIPAGKSGIVTLSYRPLWLIWGAIIAILCALFSLASAGIAFAHRSRSQ